ncbi:hypothetical protein ONS95_006949 [Cadophora gregata]|uniref:uncharacterized protein n=1 Tax=Cadophora gregata TaxID=51156 RepID=UPI0026DC6C97|nr:uncharacterized protein ONS95_006949 [Cadophora gregata]KAK0101799.1 hypothetical protein ONS95_006949 [Cadophora gregata]KAK0106186.1 hypothetical protein ONS96_003830 [Cadophora gregata f. sp. sojae]
MNSNPPNPPTLTTTTYLNDPHVIARISALQRMPESPDHEHLRLYKRLMSAILYCLFPSTARLSVLQENLTTTLRPSFTIAKLLSKPGGSAHEYDFLLGETKCPGESWSASADQLHAACAANDNETKNVYGMLQIGFELQFYKHENYRFEALGGRLHLVDDVDTVVAWAQHITANPMPLVHY